jgi:hypothetical protein
MPALLAGRACRAPPLVASPRRDKGRDGQGASNFILDKYLARTGTLALAAIAKLERGKA